MRVLMNNSCYFWFRRDLRLEDNVGLFYALMENENVQPVFIFDQSILQQLEARDARVTFIFQSIRELKNKLIELGSDLLVFHGSPEAVWADLLECSSKPKIYCNHDYEPYALIRDSSIQRLVRSFQGSFHSYKDQVIFEKDEVVKVDSTPYQIFTPYSRAWLKKYADLGDITYGSADLVSNFKSTQVTQRLISMRELGFKEQHIDVARVIPTKKLKVYSERRDFPALEGTSRLGVHLRFGTLSIRNLVKIANQTNEMFLSELIWREFYMMILWHFPHVTQRAFKTKYDSINWLNNESDFEAWQNAKTGYPLVDAGMRELNSTGFMHNRVRMVTASFLCKHLLIDWRWGEAYFAEKLLDFELASNNGGWQWAAGTGCDAAPYFRIFNPEAQTKKFDPQHAYINKWIPEVKDSSYPVPIVEHSFARDRAIKTYKLALQFQ